MPEIDVDALLTALSDDAPCGEDLEYDSDATQLETTAQYKDEQQVGDSVIEAEEPDWKSVHKLSTGLLARSRDLRFAVHLVKAAMRLDGFPGMERSLALLRGLLENYWEAVHPQLDPDDDNDPTMRINAVGSLTDPQAVLRGVSQCPLVSSRVLGRFSLRDIQIASGEVPMPSGSDDPPPDPAAIAGAFMEVELDELESVRDKVADSVEHLGAIDGAFDTHLGAGVGPNLEPLTHLLRQIKGILDEKILDRGGNAEEAADGGDADAGGGQSGGAARGGAAISGDVSTREDVVRALDKILLYYRRSEPSSPVPVLLERAKKLVGLGFMEVMQNMAPGGMPELEVLRGPQPAAEGEQAEEEASGW